MSDDLEKLRRALDTVDARLIQDLAERETLIAGVADFKIAKQRTLRDPAREAALLTKLVSHGRALGLDAYYVTRIFREVIDHAVRVQEDAFADHKNPDRAELRSWTIGYQGVEGSYSSLAAARHFSASQRELHYRGLESFSALLEAVRDRAIDFAVLPIENTTAGSINEAYDLLAQMDLSIVGEEVQTVDHCLIGFPGTAPADIRHVSSHPQALLQCSRYLSGLVDAHVEAYTDTAMAVARVAAERDPSRAAVASEEAALRYGLTVITPHIADHRENYTRFVIVANRPASFDLAVSCKSSLVFAAQHERGSLLAALQVLADHHLNLTKLESRPRRGSPWEYLFYVDFEGNSADPNVADAIQALHHAASYLKFLGSYPARQAPGDNEAEPLPAGYEPATPNVVSTHTPSKPRQIRARTVVFGGQAPVIIASAGAVHSAQSANRAARELFEMGVRVMLAAADTPQTSSRLMWLAEAAARTNLILALPCRDEQELSNAVGVADMILIPHSALEDGAFIHRVGRTDLPVLLERSPTSSVERWIQSAHTIMDAGNGRVVLLDAGIQAAAKPGSRALDLGAIVEVSDSLGLPVVIDPATYMDFTPAVLSAARLMGASGILLREGEINDMREVLTHLPAFLRSE